MHRIAAHIGLGKRIADGFSRSGHAASEIATAHGGREGFENVLILLSSLREACRAMLVRDMPPEG